MTLYIQNINLLGCFLKNNLKMMSQEQVPTNYPGPLCQRNVFWMIYISRKKNCDWKSGDSGEMKIVKSKSRPELWHSLG